MTSLPRIIAEEQAKEHFLGGVNVKEVITGRTVVEHGKGYVQKDNGEMVEIINTDLIEILTGGKVQKIKLHTLINTVTTEKWPAFAGMDCFVTRYND
jgi:hypothetical protein